MATVYSLTKPPVSLRIDRERIAMTSLYGQGFSVPWTDISGIRTVTIRQRVHGVERKQTSLAIDLIDPRAYLAQLSPVPQALGEANQHLIGTPVGISAIPFSVSLQEIRSELVKYQPNHVAIAVEA